jgi:hypothetical protein
MPVQLREEYKEEILEGKGERDYKRPAGERKKETYGGWRRTEPFVWAALRWRQINLKIH